MGTHWTSCSIRRQGRDGSDQLQVEANSAPPESMTLACARAPMDRRLGYFNAAVSSALSWTGSSQADAAKALVTFLYSPAAKTVLKAKGFE